MSETTRIFLGWDVPALPGAARVLCDEYETADELRLDRALVVLPGGRAGRRLKELLLEEADRRGLPLVPPRVTTIGMLPELLYEPARPAAEPALARLVWAEALRAVPADRLAALFAERPAEDGLRDWAALAREVGRLHREVASAGLRFGDVARRCGASPIFDDGERWDALAEVQYLYEARLGAIGLVDRDLARLRALEAGVATDRDVWLVAVTEMPPVIRDMIAALEAGTRCLVHAPAERADGFDALGCVVPDGWLDAELPLDDAALAVVDRPEQQALEVARTLAALEGRYAADDVVVGVPDRGVVPYIEQRLEDAGVPTHDAAGQRVARAGPYRLLEAVADTLDGGRFEALAALARHPDLGRWLRERGGGNGEAALRAEDAWLEPLDRYFNEHLPARIHGARLPPDGRHGPAVSALLKTLRSGALEPLRGTAPLSEWAGNALELLADVYGVRELDGERPADRRLLRSLERLRDAAAGFRRLPPELDRECTAAAAIRVILDEAGGASVPAEPDRSAVELLGWLELHLDDAPVAVVTGLNEPYLPESLNAGAFLPNGLRSLLGLVDNDRRYARDTYQLTAMLHARKTVRLIAGRRSATGDPLRPSRLIFAADPVTVARRARHFYDPEHRNTGAAVGGAAAESAAEAEAVAVADGAAAASAEVAPGEPAGAAASRFRLPPEPTIRPAEPITRLRVTDFSSLLADPYGFALSRVLELEPLDDHAREMDGMAFGGLAHRVLERFGRSEHVHETREAVVARVLEEMLEEKFDRRYGADVLVVARVQLDQLRARLRRFARWHAAWIAEGWRVVTAECGTGQEGIPFDVDGEPIRLSARIDRVDHHAGRGEWAVFDYKTGDRGDAPEATHRRGRSGAKEWVDLQLPLYHWLLPHLRDEDGNPVAPGAGAGNVRVGYILLPRDLDCVGAECADWSASELAEAAEVARDVVRKLRSGPFTYDPDVRARYPDPRMEALLGRGQLAAGDEEAGEEAAAEGVA